MTTSPLHIPKDTAPPVIERPTSLPEAIALFGMREGKTAILAGGTDLLPKIERGESAPEILVDLSSVDELKALSDLGEKIEIGAMATHRELSNNAIIASFLPALAAAAKMSGAEAHREKATIGGNIMSALSTGDLLPVLFVFEAEYLLQNLTGERWVPTHSFFTGKNKTAILPGELLTRIRLSKQSPAERAAFHTATLNGGDWRGKINLCARATIVHGGIAQIAIAVGGAAETVLRLPGTEALLRGQVLNSSTIRKAVLSIEDEVSPVDHPCGTEAECRHLCGEQLEKFLRESKSL